ncbi:hypothetical protein BN903_38 [Halorubrum sp. AJ67]|nr:hypothetical protein BN903_38 [Halorubrum sp. AJ67]
MLSLFGRLWFRGERERYTINPNLSASMISSRPRTADVRNCKRFHRRVKE